MKALLFFLKKKGPHFGQNSRPGDSDPYTCIYWRVQMDLNLHTQNIRLKVRCLSTRLREPHTHTHSHTYNKSQGILSKRSAEPGQTEGGRRTSTGAEPVRQLPTFFVSSVHGHPTSALAKVTSTRSICCSYFWATCRPLFTSDASANCSPKYLLVTLKYCGRHHGCSSRVWSHISQGMMEIKLRWMRMIVSGLWGGNSRWHHSVDHPGPDFLYFHFFLCLCICQVTTWCNCVFVYVCSCIFHLCVFLLVSHEMYLFFRPHWVGGCVFVFVDTGCL